MSRKPIWYKGFLIDYCVMLRLCLIYITRYKAGFDLKANKQGLYAPNIIEEFKGTKLLNSSLVQRLTPSLIVLLVSGVSLGSNI